MGLVGGELLDGGPRLVEDGRELAQLRRRLRGALLLPRELLQLGHLNADGGDEGGMRCEG